MPESSLTEMGKHVEDDDVDYLSMLVGDGKKYKDVTELAKAYHNADRHIRELRDDLETKEAERTSINEVLEEIRKGKNKEEDQNPPVDNASGNGLTEEKIAELMDARLTQRDRNAIAQSNVDNSIAKLSEIYGSRSAAMKAVNQSTKGNEEVERILDDLSKTDVEATVAFVTARVPVSEVRTNTPGSGVDAVHAGPGLPEGIITWTYARKLRKENPAEYNSPAFREKLLRSAQYFQDKGRDFYQT